MARNFRIQTSGTDRTFFIDLIGDFDGSSAFELLNLLQEKLTTKSNKAYINTTRLKSIHPFGRDVFVRNFSNIGNMDRILFTGSQANELAPAEKMTLRWQQRASRKPSFIAALEASANNRSQQLSAGGN
mgnify:CR=1 FL=1